MTTKAKHRLHIDKLLSIGAISGGGDNPESEIVLAKAKPRTPEQAQELFCSLMSSKMHEHPEMSQEDAQREVLANRPILTAELSKSGPPSFSGVSGTAGGRGRPGRSLSPAERTALVTKTLLDRRDEQIEEIHKTNEQSRRDVNAIRAMRGTNMAGSEATAGSVRSEVDRLAASMVKKGEAATLIEARPMVWREHPELVAKSRREAPESVGGGSDKTITDRIREVIDEATRKASWQPLMQGWGDGMTREQVISKVRLEMWQTPDGRELRDLERKYGAKPYTPTTSREIRKSRGGGQYERALNLLDSGIWSG